MAVPLTAAPSLIAASTMFGPKLWLTAMHVISLWANLLPLRGLSRTSRRTRHCVGLQSSCTKRSTIARASPSHAVPSNIIEASFTLWSSAFSFSFSFSNTAGIRSFIWLLEVELCAYVLKIGCRISTFEMGIPAKRSVSTTSNQKSLVSEGKVEPLAWFRLPCFFKHWRIVWPSFFVLAMLEIPFKCFSDLTCFSTLLFFWASVSWQALHPNCPRTHSRCCPGNYLILSQIYVLDLGFFYSRLALYWPLFTITFRFREMEAFSQSKTQHIDLYTV